MRWERHRPRDRGKPLCLAIVATMLIAEPGQAASPRLFITEAGKDAPIGVYAVVRRNCSVGAAPDIHVVRAPTHGALVVQDTQIAAERDHPCAPVTAPARRIVYRPAVGFTGQDEVLFEIVDRDIGRSDQHPVTIVVQPSLTGI